MGSATPRSPRGYSDIEILLQFGVFANLFAPSSVSGYRCGNLPDVPRPHLFL